MEKLVLDFAVASDIPAPVATFDVLNDLELAIVGGGIGDTVL